MVEKLLDWLFKTQWAYDDPTCHLNYYKCWFLGKPFGRYDVCLNRFRVGDMRPFFHDHYDDILSIGLKGSYLERWVEPGRLGHDTPQRRMFSAPWAHLINAYIQHQVLPCSPTVWTITIGSNKLNRKARYYRERRAST